MVYFAKIKRINRKREKCTVVFDDKSQDEADFCQIHSGKVVAWWEQLSVQGILIARMNPSIL